MPREPGHESSAPLLRKQVVKSIAEGRESACKRVRFLIAARLESLNALELR